MSFFESQFVKDLEKGKLPPIEIAISEKELIKLSVALVVTGVAILLVNGIIKTVIK